MQLVQHPVSKGHRQIAHITNVDNASTVVRAVTGLSGCASGSGHSVPPGTGVDRHRQPEAGYHDVYEALAARLLEPPGPPTAVFCVHDVLALRLIDALRAKGVRVPEDMAVAGFDGLERWLPGSPFLTTADQPFERDRRVGVRGYCCKELSWATGERTSARAAEAPLHIHASTRQSRREGETHLFHSRRETS